MVIKSFKNLINKIQKKLFNKEEMTTVYGKATTVYEGVTTGTAPSQVHDTATIVYLYVSRTSTTFIAVRPDSDERDP